MDTPPSSGAAGKPNMHFKNREFEEDITRNEMMMRFGPKYALYKKEQPANMERENVAKTLSELKKQGDFLKETKWMFENNPGLHIDNFSANPL